MKKYLMMGVAALALASCSHDDIQFAQPPVNPNPTKAEQYQTAFVSTFGVPAATQTWGFNQGRVMSAPGRRAHNANGNQWEDQGYVIPSDITKEELDNVLAVFNEEGAKSYKSLVDWDCFFVQQVYKGVATYTDHANQFIGAGSNKMDWLCTVTDKKTEVVSYCPYEEKVVIVDPYDEHINNFNNGKCTSSWTSQKTGIAVKDMMLMVNSNTNKFGFKASQDNGHVFYNFRMEKIDGNYYVGFDFEADGNNPNEQVDRDYIYNDWIVKIVPGKGISDGGDGGDGGDKDEVKESGRIICEDLGTIGDFDFNDVVFDATIYESGKTVITLQAAGGTLELSVAGVEVHEALLGAGNAKKGNVYKMINTGADVTCDPKTFVAEGTYSSLNDIPVVVSQTDNAGNVTSYELSAKIGMAPQKICVPTVFKWCKERKSLKDAYPGFKDWATGDSSVWSAEFDNSELIYGAE